MPLLRVPGASAAILRGLRRSYGRRGRQALRVRPVSRLRRYVAAHRDTLLPMGTLADRNLRRKRMEAHSALNRVIASGLMTRKQAYRWLQVRLGLPESEAHIAKFSELRCQKVIDLCRALSRAQARAA